jgi:hypothetical protein
MTPPLVCPSPEPLDCPLYEQRVAHFSPAETLRRAILTERRRPTADLGALIRAESRPASTPQAALPPAPEPVSLSILDHINAEEESK